MSRHFVVAAAIVFGGAVPAAAQESRQSTEMYHIFDFKTAAPKRDAIAAAEAGLRRNTTDADMTTPVVMGPAPATPGQFKIVNPFENSGMMGGLAGLMGASQMAQMKRATCDGAIWMATAERNKRLQQSLRLTMCLFPYQGGYHLNVHGIDIKEKGGGIALRLGRAMAQRVVGNADAWTGKTVLDTVRSIRAGTNATVSYMEGQPEFTGTPWLDEAELVPGKDDKGC